MFVVDVNNDLFSGLSNKKHKFVAMYCKKIIDFNKNTHSNNVLYFFYEKFSFVFPIK